jgi:hypothetical protein
LNRWRDDGLNDHYGRYFYLFAFMVSRTLYLQC